jgi:uncharacterized membrane protein YfcA
VADLTPSRRTTLNLVSLTLVGKVLAIGKTLFIAALFGTSSHLDAFWVAYSLPLLLPNVLSLTITTAFVPRFVASLEGRTSPEVWRGANTLFTLILILIAAGGAAIFIWASPLIGLITGSICGATGIFVVPTAPYLTSLRMSTEELVQSIGISAFICPLALTIALAVHGRYSVGLAGSSFLALLPALAGMYIGIRIRRRLPAAVFMRWFFVGLIALGTYMFLRGAKLL